MAELFLYEFYNKEGIVKPSSSLNRPSYLLLSWKQIGYLSMILYLGIFLIFGSIIGRKFPLFILNVNVGGIMLFIIGCLLRVKGFYEFMHAFGIFILLCGNTYFT